MSTDYTSIIHRATQLGDDLVSKSIQLLQRILELEVEIKRSDLDDEMRNKIIILLEKLREDIIQEISYSQETRNLYKPDLQVIE